MATFEIGVVGYGEEICIVGFVGGFIETLDSFLFLGFTSLLNSFIFLAYAPHNIYFMEGLEFNVIIVQF